MKTLLLLIMFPFCVSAQKHIRNVNWGDSRAIVKKSESLRLVSDDSKMSVYDGTLGGLKFSICYNYSKDKLYKVYYLCDEKHSNSNGYVNDYVTLKEILTKKYGDPTESGVNWTNDLFKDDTQSWGLAISMGYGSLKSRWETDATEIYLVCTGNDLKITLGVMYSSKSLAAEAEKETDQKNKEDF